MTAKTKLIRVRRISLEKHEEKKSRMEETVKLYTGKRPKISWSQYFDILGDRTLVIPEGTIIKRVRRIKRR